MPERLRLGIVSDIHYACAAEQARGANYEYAGIHNPLLRLALRFYRHFFWLRDPLHQNYLVDKFLAAAGGLDYLVANGDYSCNTASLGVSDEAACESVRECLAKLRQPYGGRFRANFGDHELGKVSLIGGRGGMRLTSWHCAVRDLGLEPFWQVSLGSYRMIGIVSSLVALPTFEADTLPEEREEWRTLRAAHLDQIRRAFFELPPDARVLLFCHDPTALPFLLREPLVAAKLGQLEQTIIGHLHSNLILWKSRLLAGMPKLGFLGHTASRLSAALREARDWRSFRVRLCPSLAGIELLKDGGYLTAELDPDARQPARFELHRIKRR